MEHSLFLRQYKYEILGSTVDAGVPALNQLGQISREPALWAFFDFENGNLQLEGDYRYILHSNNGNKNGWLRYHKNRVFIDANMKPEIPAGPDDNLNNELLLLLKGSIYNGSQRHICSGLLSLSRTGINIDSQWMIYCTLMDNDLNRFEIKFKLPVYTGITKSPNHN